MFYALRDTKTPMKIAVSMVAFFNFYAEHHTLVWFMQEGDWHFPHQVSALIQSIILLGILRETARTQSLASDH